LRPLIKARPTASICCSPPLRVAGLLLARSSRRGKMPNTRLRSRAIASLSLRAKQASLRFSSDREVAEKAAALGHVADAQLTHHLVGRIGQQILAVETHSAARLRTAPCG
jgi:hypothetical protein